MLRKALFLLSVLLFCGIVNAEAPWGLVGNWIFNDGTANDSSSVGVNGTLYNGAVIVNDPSGSSRRGKVLDTRNGTAANGKMEAPDNPSWQFTDYATINAWVLVPTLADAQKCPWWSQMAGRGGNGTPRLFYNYNGTAMHFFDYSTWIGGGSLNTGAWSDPLPYGMTWHMITSTIHPSTDPCGVPIKAQSIYIDGVYKGEDTTTASDSFMSVSAPFAAGAVSNVWSGYIDDVGYWHGWLEPETIAGLYDGTYTNATAPYSVDYPDSNNLGDMNGNYIINEADLNDFAQYWLSSGCIYPAWCGGADMTHDSIVNFKDFCILAANWLKDFTPQVGIVGKVEQSIGGVPTFKVDSDWLTIPGYSCLAAWPVQLKSMEPLAAATPLPTKVYDFPITALGAPGTMPDASTGPGTYNWGTVDRYYGTFNTMKYTHGYSNTVVLPRLYMYAPAWWLNDPANANEMEVQDDGTTQSTLWSGYSSNNGTLPNAGPFPSLASAKYRLLVKGCLEDFIDYAASKGYLQDSIGFELSGLATEEWYYYGFNRGGTARELAGYSIPTRDAFRQWLRTKYNNDNAALQTSWNNGTVTFDTATVPTRAARLDRLNSSTYTFRNVTSNMNVIDFYQFWNDLVADFIDYCAGVIKSKTGNQKLVGAFYAYMYEFTSDISESGQLGYGRFLNSSNLDYVYVTNSYFNRGLGKADLLRAQAYSAQLHNKIWFNSDDTMTVNGPYIMAQFGWDAATIGDNETRMGYTDTIEKNQWMFRRQTGFNVTSGFYQHHLELWSRNDANGTYTSMYTGLENEIGYLNQFSDRSKNYDRSSNSEILIVSDEYSCHYAASTGLLRASLEYPQLALQQIGAGADHVLLNDLGLINAAQYKMVVFLNCWNLSDAQRTLVNNLKNSNRMLVFCYGTGYFNGQSASASNIQAMTGMTMYVSSTEIFRSTTITLQNGAAGTLANALYSTGIGSFSAGDICKRIYVNDTSVSTLGLNGSYKYMGYKDMGTWKSVYSIHAQMPAKILRELARYAGVHIYNNDDDAFRANKSYVYIHPSSAGSRTINFPRAVTLYDALSEQVLGTNITSYTRSYQLGETMIYRYE